MYIKQTVSFLIREVEQSDKQHSFDTNGTQSKGDHHSKHATNTKYLIYEEIKYFEKKYIRSDIKSKIYVVSMKFSIQMTVNSLLNWRCINAGPRSHNIAHVCTCCFAENSNTKIHAPNVFKHVVCIEHFYNSLLSTPIFREKCIRLHK